jgi:hypothetical protein
MTLNKNFSNFIQNKYQLFLERFFKLGDSWHIHKMFRRLVKSIEISKVAVIKHSYLPASLKSIDYS